MTIFYLLCAGRKVYPPVMFPPHIARHDPVSDLPV